MQFIFSITWEKGGYVGLYTRTGPTHGRHGKVMESPMLGEKIKEAAKNILRGSRQLTKYTKEYYRKYNSLTRAEKFREYLLQHSQNSGYPVPRYQRRRDTSNQHQYHGFRFNETEPSFLKPKLKKTRSKYCSCNNKVNYSVASSLCQIDNNCSDKACDFKWSKILKNHSEIESKYEPRNCDMKYFSAPHLYSASEEIQHEVPVTNNRKGSRHVRFLNPLHTSAPDLVPCYKSRILPATPHQFLPYSFQPLYTQQGLSKLPRSSANHKKRRHSECYNISFTFCN